MSVYLHAKEAKTLPKICVYYYAVCKKKTIIDFLHYLTFQLCIRYLKYSVIE